MGKLSYTITTDDVTLARQLISLTDLVDGDGEVWSETVDAFNFFLEHLRGVTVQAIETEDHEMRKFVGTLRNVANSLEQKMDEDTRLQG